MTDIELKELNILANRIAVVIGRKDFTRLFFDPDLAAIRKCVASESTDSQESSLLLHIGKQIKNRRVLKKISQLTLAHKVHIHVSQASRHERGKQLTIDILEEYANALGCSIHDFLPPEQNDDICQKRVDKIVNMFPEVLKLPEDQQDMVFDMVENFLKLALEKRH